MQTNSDITNKLADPKQYLLHMELIVVCIILHTKNIMITYQDIHFRCPYVAFLTRAPSTRDLFQIYQISDIKKYIGWSLAIFTISNVYCSCIIIQQKLVHGSISDIPDLGYKKIYWLVLSNIYNIQCVLQLHKYTKKISAWIYFRYTRFRVLTKYIGWSLAIFTISNVYCSCIIIQQKLVHGQPSFISTY